MLVVVVAAISLVEGVGKCRLFYQMIAELYGLTLLIDLCRARLALVKRSRVVKGSKPPTPSPVKPSTVSKETSRVKSASSTVTGSFKQPIRNGHISSKQRAPSNEPGRRPAPKARETSCGEPSKVRANYSGRLATPNDFMASIQRMSTPRIPSATATPPLPVDSAPETNLLIEDNVGISDVLQNNTTVRGNSPVHIDLMDLDEDSDTPEQPVLDFTHPLDSASHIEGSQECSLTRPSSVIADISPFSYSIETHQDAGMPTHDSSEP